MTKLCFSIIALKIYHYRIQIHDVPYTSSLNVCSTVILCIMIWIIKWWRPLSREIKIILNVFMNRPNKCPNTISRPWNTSSTYTESTFLNTRAMNKSARKLLCFLKLFFSCVWRLKLIRWKKLPKSTASSKFSKMSLIVIKVELTEKLISFF